MKGYGFLLASVSTLAFGGVAFAQDVERREDTIVVLTTPGPARAADELIGNATVIDREDIVESLASSLGDTLENQPGVSTTFFGQGASRPVLRGLGAERVLVLTNGQGVIDASAASPDHQVSADGIDAQRIEILRGPAALAFGGQAIGGVVNVIDGLIVEELPEDLFEAEGLVAYNSVNEGNEIAGRVVGSTGPFVFTFSASGRDFDNYDIPGFAESAGQMAAEEEEHDDDHDDDHEHEEEEGVRDTLENSFLETSSFSGGVSWIGDNAFLGVSVRQTTSEYGLPGHGHEHGEEGEDHDDDHDDDHDEDHEHEEEEGAFIDLEQTRLDVRGGLKFVDNAYFSDVNVALSYADYEHTEFEGPGEAGTVFDSEGFEGRVEIGTTFGAFEGALGVQVLDKSFGAIGEEAFISETETQSSAVFLYQTQEFDTGIGVEGGLRLEQISLDNVNQGERSFNLFNGSVGLHKHMSNGLFVGGQIAITERAPNESELFADGPHLATDQFEVGNSTLDIESGLNLEGTVRWTGENASFGVNLFVTDFSNFIYLEPGQTVEDGQLVSEADGLAVFVFAQEDADFKGGEIYGRYSLDGPLNAEWEFDAALDFVEAEFDGGTNVPFLPPVTFTAGASAEWGALEVGGRLTIAGDQDDPGTGQLPTDDYTRLDLRGEVDLSDYGWGADGTELFIEGRNITDEEIRYASSVLKDLAPAPGANVRIGLRAVF